MAKHIKPEDLGKELKDILETYQFKSKQHINAVTDETSTELLADVRARAPERTGKYKKSLRRTKKTSMFGTDGYVIHARSPHYRRAHLLEKGHAKVGGGRVQAYPHFEPATKAISPIYINRLKKALSDE